MSKEVIVQFVWPHYDEGDYLTHRTMTEEEIAEVEALLTIAEDLGRIRSGWYVGPLGHSTTPHTTFMDELRGDLDVECRCVPTLSEAHQDCPFHGIEEA